MIAVATSEKTLGEVTNLGSSFEISIGDMANSIAKLMGLEVSIKCDQERIRPEKSEVNRLFADNTKARKLTGWSPEFSGLAGFEKGLEQTIEWFQEPQNLKNYKIDIYNI